MRAPLHAIQICENRLTALQNSRANLTWSVTELRPGAKSSRSGQYVGLRESFSRTAE